MNPALLLKGLKIVGQGTLPDPTLYPDGVFWVDGDGVAWQNGYSFLNNGLDYVAFEDIGDLISSNMVPGTHTYTVRMVLNPSLINNRRLIGSGESTSSFIRASFKSGTIPNTRGGVYCGVANTSSANSGSTDYIFSGQLLSIVFKIKESNFTVCANGVEILNAVIGSDSIVTDKFDLFKYPPAEAGCFAGKAYQVSFHKGYKSGADCSVSGLDVIDVIDFNQPSGSAIVSKVKGITGNLTDGAPLGQWVRDWRPLHLGLL